MTAVETILHSLVPNAPSTLIPKPVFNPIREALIHTLDQFDLSQEEASVLVGNIKGVNRAPMSRKIKAVVEKYDLASSVFSDDRIRLLNKQRNAITHQGKALDGESLWNYILYARELIALIVFAELRYKGRYQSYAEGHEQKTMAGPVTVLCRSKCSFKPPSVRKRPGFSNPVLNDGGADCKSRLCIRR